MRRFFQPADGPIWLGQMLSSIRSALGDIWDHPIKLFSKATADLPPAADYTGGIQWDSTDSIITWSDGSSWLQPSLSTHVHAAADVTFAPAGGIAATDVQAAIVELDTEKLAASSYTAADVLAKLLTVDGAGSGLDADLLDGMSSAAFAAASHTHAIADVTGLQAELDGKLSKTVSATSRILGRGTAGSGDTEELSMAEGIGNDGTTLYAGAGPLIVPITGGFLDGNQASYAATAAAAVASGRIQLVPFTPDLDVTIDQLGVNVTVAAAGNAKVVVYAANSVGWPGALIVESTDLDTSTTGFKSYSYSYTFKKGRRYWIGCRFSATPTVTVVPISALRPFGKSAAASNPGNHLNIGGIAYASAAPDPCVASSTVYFAATAPPACMMRVA